MHWKRRTMNDSFISARLLRRAGQRIGVQTGSSGLRFSHCSVDKCHSQRSGRCWGTWRTFAGSDSVWQCAFSLPYHPPHLPLSFYTTKSAMFAVGPNELHFFSLLHSQGTKSFVSVIRRRFDVILGLILPQRLDVCVNSSWLQMGWHVMIGHCK